MCKLIFKNNNFINFNNNKKKNIFLAHTNVYNSETTQ